MEATKQRQTIFTLFGSDLVLGLLVALLSVLTALAAYQSSIYDSKEGDLNVEGQKLLTDSNSLYLEANQFIIYDFTLYDGWYINDGQNEEIAQYYYDNFSESLLASMERETGPFDPQYYTDTYAEAEVSYDEAIVNFENAQEAGDTADRLQLVVLIFAVGLALSAYASMLDKENRLRYVFAICSVAAFIFGVIKYLF